LVFGIWYLQFTIVFYRYCTYIQFWRQGKFVMFLVEE